MRLVYIAFFIISYMCHLTIVIGLPITSQPLASNPEHLTWDAWLMSDTEKHPDHKAKKITPKSIFITPNLQNTPTHNCPPDHKLDSNGRCVQIVKIDPDELLVNRIQALLGGTASTNLQPSTAGAGDDLYDYDYEEEEDSPFHLNLPLTFEAVYPEDALPLKGIEEEDLLPFRPPKGSRPDSEPDEGKISFISVEKISNETTAETNRNTTEKLGDLTDIQGNNMHNGSDIKRGTTLYNTTISENQTISNGNDTILDQSDSSSTLTVTKINFNDAIITITTTTTTTATTTTSGDQSTETDMLSTEIFTTNTSTNQKLSEYEDIYKFNTTEVISNFSNETSIDYDENVVNTTTSTITTMEQDESMGNNVHHRNNNQTTATTGFLMDDAFDEVVTGEMEWINYSNSSSDESGEEMDLENESFMMSNKQEMPIISGQVTQSDMITTILDDESSKIVDTSIDSSEPSSPQESVSSGASEPSLFIVTPETITKPKHEPSWYPSVVQAPTRYRQKVSDISSTTTTTPVPIQEIDRILLGPTDEQTHETNNREQANKHETSEAYLENLDSNNRFVYHHLTSLKPETTPITTTTTPSPSSNENIIKQIKEINRIVTENKLRHPNYPTRLPSNPIRFPSASHESQTIPHNSDFVFPTDTAPISSSGSRFVPSYSQSWSSQPSTTSTTSTTTPKPPFWWLPNNWEIDQSGQKPILLRFWERMPLVRDPSMMQRSSSRSTRRENSRSPSENLYKEISTQDIYRVLQNSNRDWKHTNS